jgi:hypothetical protein
VDKVQDEAPAAAQDDRPVQRLREALRRQRGGIAGLLRLVAEHGEAIEADLPAHYPGVRLKHLFTGELTWRELGVFLRGLPPASRLRTALNGGQPAWTGEQYILADIFDALAQANWQRGGDAKKRLPKSYPRPGDDRRGRDSAERIAAMADARERARERARAIAAGEIT